MVKTENNKIYRADYVMVSVSLGVLQTDLIRFRPQLPVSSSIFFAYRLKDSILCVRVYTIYIV
jgi:hypothetical protein